jgi:hypothetical protein
MSSESRYGICLYSGTIEYSLYLRNNLKVLRTTMSEYSMLINQGAGESGLLVVPATQIHIIY